MQTCRQGSGRILWRSVCYILCQPLNYSALSWRPIHFTGQHRAWQIYTFADLIVKFSFSALSKRKRPIVFIWRARGTKWVIEWESSTFGDPESASCKRVGRHKECNLLESSMISSSLKLGSFFMSQRFCNFTQLLFMCDSETIRNEDCLIWRSNFPRCVVHKLRVVLPADGREWINEWVPWNYNSSVAQTLEPTTTAL